MHVAHNNHTVAVSNHTRIIITYSFMLGEESLAQVVLLIFKPDIFWVSACLTYLLAN